MVVVITEAGVVLALVVVVLVVKEVVVTEVGVVLALAVVVLVVRRQSQLLHSSANV